MYSQKLQIRLLHSYQIITENRRYLEKFILSEPIWKACFQYIYIYIYIYPSSQVQTISPKTNIKLFLVYLTSKNTQDIQNTSTYLAQHLNFYAMLYTHLHTQNQVISTVDIAHRNTRHSRRLQNFIH